MGKDERQTVMRFWRLVEKHNRVSVVLRVSVLQLVLQLVLQFVH